MGSTHRVLIRIEAEQAAWFEAHHGRTFPIGTWVDVMPVDEGGRAVSRLLGATVAELELRSSVSQIWIHGFVEGGLTRQLLYDQGAWQLVEGVPFDFEDHASMRRWVARKRLGSHHGERVFEALLGRTFVQGGVVSGSHLRADITPADVEADEARERARMMAAEDAAAQAQKENVGEMFVYAEAHHEWSKALALPPSELPIWVPCHADLPPPVVSTGLGCRVVTCTFLKAPAYLSVAVFEGGELVRLLSWQDARWTTDGPPLDFEDQRAVGQFLSSSALPDARAFCRAVLGTGRPVTTRSLGDEVLQSILERSLKLSSPADCA